METLSSGSGSVGYASAYANGVPSFRGGWRLSQTSVNLVGHLVVAYNQQIPLGEELHGVGHSTYTEYAPTYVIPTSAVTTYQGLSQIYTPHRYWYTEVVLNKDIYNLEGEYQASMVRDLLKMGLVQLGRVMCGNGQNNIPCEVTCAIQQLEPPSAWLNIKSYYYPKGKYVTEKYLYTTDPTI